jgi:hypothetical protein
MEKERNSKNVHTTVHRNEGINIRDLMIKKSYSEPKIYIPKINGKATVIPGKRWHVYFYWRSESGKLDHKCMYTKGINRLKTVKERKAAGMAIAAALTEIFQGVGTH